MQQKLFPPYIEGILPAISFTNNTKTLSIPFSHNPTVNNTNILGYRLQIKTVSTNDLLMTLTTIGFTQNNTIIFDLTSEQINKLKDFQGEYLKFQLAYIKKDIEVEGKLIEIQKRFYDIKELIQYPDKIDLKIDVLQFLDQLMKINTIYIRFIKYLPQITDTQLINMARAQLQEIDNIYQTLTKQYNSSNYNIDILTGYYSTVGVAKLCYPTEITISKTNDLDSTNLIKNQLSSSTTNFLNNNTVYGIYSSPNDSSEKVYSYIFNIYDEDNNLLETSGEQLHNNSSNINSSSYDKFRFNTNLEPGINYLFEYAITTTNKLQQRTTYIIKQQPTFKPDSSISLTAAANQDNGYIQLNLNLSKLLTIGHFILYRTDEYSSFKNWTQILAFDISHKIGEIKIWKDLSIEQGVVYQYAIEQYNTQNIHTQKILSNKVKAKFEDLFLFDGERQLNIKFNPKVSTFKDTILEQKIETIGSQYPFMFKNGKVKYKEFAISGLISYNMDIENLFINGIDLGVLEDNYLRAETPSLNQEKTSNLGRNTNVSESNVTLERKFKLEVLKWLNNGKIKCFKSPTEGNYLVQLTNVSLSPEDQLGRMLHNFSATAYEMKDYSMLNIIDLWYYDKIQSDLKNYNNAEYTETTIQLRDVLENNSEDNIIIFPQSDKMIDGVCNIWFQNIMPGTEFNISYKDRINNTNSFTTNNSNFIINNTGYLSFENLPQDHIITNLTVKNKALSPHESGQITFGYYTTIDTSFDHITNVTNKDIIGQQYHYDNYKNQNIIKVWNNETKSSITKFYALQFSRINYNFGHVYDLVKNLKIGDKISTNYYRKIEQHIPDLATQDYFRPVGSKYEVVYNNFIGNNKTVLDNIIEWKEKDKQINWFIISEYKNPTETQKQKIYLDKKNTLLYLDNIDNIKYIELGPNVVADISYEFIEYDYDFEQQFYSELSKILNKNDEQAIFQGTAKNRKKIQDEINNNNTKTIVLYYWEQKWTYLYLQRLFSADFAASDFIKSYIDWYKYNYQMYVSELKNYISSEIEGGIN